MKGSGQYYGDSFFVLCVAPRRLLNNMSALHPFECPSWRESQAFIAPRVWAQQRIKKNNRPSPAAAGVDRLIYRDEESCHSLRDCM